ncbi:armadillo repeat-containing protein 5 [Denticeps clupeoides]|uniref:armadillo repeat-containing protein 5 n=1 Tax=Denticeps clupeoides TaxID=299321 RepID=UPI0010A2A989|nr:armadillo repeat-containing protein 5 [Denticeps clupeoides]
MNRKADGCFKNYNSQQRRVEALAGDCGLTMATQASLQNVKGSNNKESALPESSLTWCLSQLAKVATSTDHQKTGLRGSDNRNGEGRERARETQKRLQASQWRALVAIRTQHIKGGTGRVGRYRVQGGLPPLLDLLRRPDTSRKILDLSLSILANCCTEKETRTEVRKLDGVSAAVEVLRRNVAVETVENRAARALGNLAMDPEGSALIHSAGGVPLLILCLSLRPSSPSPAALPTLPKLERAQSAARALLYLADTPANRLSLLSQGAVPALVSLISPDQPAGLRRASLRALHEVTRGCGAECAREVSRCGALAPLGPLASGEGTRPLEELALKTLANLCSQGCLRPLVGSLGVIPKFSEEAKRDALKSGVFLRALCLCCKEAVNRVKVKDSGGLEVLIHFLSAHQNHPLTRLVVLACVDFVYDEAALEQMQDLGLVPLLVARLVDFSKGEEPEAGLTSATCGSAELMSSSCFDSFDFPHSDGTRKEDGAKEQGSSSFLSLRSWLVSEGLISSEEELQDSGVESDWGSFYSSPSPSSSSSSSSPMPYLPDLGSSTTSKNGPLPSPSKPGVTPQSPSPSSTPKPISPSKVCSPARKRLRVSSSSSLSCSSVVALDAPPALSKGPLYHHPYHPEPWAPESPILLLLSRFSHATDPSPVLVTTGVLSGLLLYLTQHRDPSGRCFRMLGRLSCNPNCLRALLRTGAVALIRHRLCARDRPARGRGQQSDRVKAKIKQLGLGLLSNLRVQCESGFGVGVLTHIMLSGVETDRLLCALSLPLICSNKNLLKKLLLDNSGLMFALEHLGCDDNDGDRGLAFLAGWLRPLQEVSAPQLHALYSALLIGCLSSLLSNSKGEQERKKVAVETSPATSLPEPGPTRCSYSRSKHDLLLLLDDGSQVPACREAVSGGDGEDAESGYFRALLKGGFGEARGCEEAISLRDVTPGMLLPVLHYLHGCRLDAREAPVEVGGGPGQARGSQCDFLASLFSGCVSLVTDGLFLKSAVAEVMVGACRFLVAGLQRAAEDLCVSLLLSLDAAPAREAGPKPRDLPRLLPQLYWFSQRYNYPRLGRACLSVLLRPQGAPPADCLLRLARQADCPAGLKRDLLGLAAAALG